MFYLAFKVFAWNGVLILSHRLKFLAGLLAAIVFAGPSLAEEGATIVRLDSVRSELMAQTMPVLGRLIAQQTGVVASRSKGAVEELTVSVGDRVKKGQVLARLVAERLEWQRELGAAEVLAAEAAMEASEAQVKLLAQEMARLERLRKSAAFSQARFEDKNQEVLKAKGDLSAAKAAHIQAKANLALSEIGLKDAAVVAPYPGVVTVRHTEVGAYLDIGAPVVTLLDDESMELEADVPSGRTGGLVPGKEVLVSIGNEKGLKASVRAVVPQENPLTRTQAVRFTPKFDTAQQFAANQSATLHIPIGSARDITTVHKDAILNRKGRQMVYIAQKGAAEIRPVKLGDAVGQRFEVLSGLSTGDQVVVRGNERLRPGEKIRTGS